MSYTTIIKKLNDNGFRPVSHISKGLKEERIVRLEVYASPILKSDIAESVKAIVGDSYNVYSLNNYDGVFIELEN